MQTEPPANQYEDEDQILWQRVTRRVTPLSGCNQTISSLPTVQRPVHPAKPAPKISKKTPPSEMLPPTTVKPPSPVDLREGDRAGLDGRTRRRLFRGDVPIDRRLDLHGHSAARAQIKLQRFIEDALMQNAVVYW